MKVRMAVHGPVPDPDVEKKGKLLVKQSHPGLLVDLPTDEANRLIGVGQAEEVSAADEAAAAREAKAEVKAATTPPAKKVRTPVKQIRTPAKKVKTAPRKTGGWR